MKRISRGALLSVLLLAACTAPMMHGNESASIPMEMDGDSGRRGGMMGGMMGGATGGMMGGMMDRHHATVPEEYRGVTNPAAVTDASLERGAEVYSLNCASCHGDGGMGDGPAGLVLDPPASPIAHTSQMLGDDYLFWRLSEGGAHFASAMPAWKEILDEQTRWDLINYMRALGSGDVTPRRMAGGATFDPQQELLHRQEMLDTALADEVISQEEADLFLEVHAVMDTHMADTAMEPMSGNMEDQLSAMLASLVEMGEISQVQGDSFQDLHTRLLDAGLMQ